MNGILIIDKPEGMTSAKVVAQVKRLTQSAKVGHTGTLDPFATGVMICCINQATRLASFFLHRDKTYQAVLCLGIETDTQDVTGSIVSRSDNIHFSENRILTVFDRFKGAIQQQPSVYSALKYHGVPLYRLARKGTPVQKPARSVFISELRVTKISLPEIQFEVTCSSGTYIRTLASDIGRELGCGAHLTRLRRTENSGFSIREAITLSELEERALHGRVSEQIIPMAEALKDMPGFKAKPETIERITHGKRITTADIPIPLNIDRATEYFVKIIDAEDSLVAVLRLGKAETIYRYGCVFSSG